MRTIIRALYVTPESKTQLKEIWRAFLPFLVFIGFIVAVISIFIIIGSNNNHG